VIFADVIISRRSDVQSRPMSEGTVLVDMSSGEVFELNTIAADIWILLEVPVTEAELSAAVRAKYGVSAETADEDVRGFLSSLTHLGLIRISSPRSRAD